jgi:LmbE family N-acetylglucosaminyl deacetylase
MATPKPERRTLNPVVVISPHLDDAVLSCGQLLAARPGSTVITVFAGVPDAAQASTDWDRRCGFASAAEAMTARREEDSRALGLLRAKPLWLDFLDSQYGETPSAGEICLTLQQALRDLAPDEVLVPLGLFHSDHLLVHEACDAALRVPPSVPLLVYEDVPYRGITDLLAQRLAGLRKAGARALSAHLGGRGAPGLKALKAQAVACYASQLRGLGPRGAADAARPERYWQLDWAEEPQREDAETRPHLRSDFVRRVGC